MNLVSERVQWTEKELLAELSNILFEDTSDFQLCFSFRGYADTRWSVLSSFIHKKISNFHLDYIESVARDSSNKRSGEFFSIYTPSVESKGKMKALDVSSELGGVKFVLLDFHFPFCSSASVLILVDQVDFDLDLKLHDFSGVESKIKRMVWNFNAFFWEESARDIAALFNGVEIPIALLSKSLEVRCLNSRFYEFATKSSGLSIDGGMIRVVSEQINNDVLNETLLAAVDSKQVSHCILPGEASPVFLTALPLRQEAECVEGEACLAIILTGEGLYRGKKQLDKEYFRFRWGLSNKEARVSELLVSDLSIDDIARKLNLSGETVRWYLKKLCSKFSVSGRLGFMHYVYNDFIRFIG